MSRWRTGTKLGRTIYRDDVLMGMMDSAEVAEAVVRAMNAVAVPANGVCCAFCEKPRDEVKWLIAGKFVSICSECIIACIEVVDKERAANDARENKGD